MNCVSIQYCCYYIFRNFVADYAVMNIYIFVNLSLSRGKLWLIVVLSLILIHYIIKQLRFGKTYWQIREYLHRSVRLMFSRHNFGIKKLKRSYKSVEIKRNRDQLSNRLNKRLTSPYISMVSRCEIIMFTLPLDI